MFDPFAGTGTVLTRAAELGRRPLGLETNRDLVEAHVLPTLARPVETTAAGDPSASTVLKLRALKYARVVHERADCAQLLVKHPVRCAIVDAVVQPRRHRKVTGTLTYVVEGNPSSAQLERLLGAFVASSSRKPASKFGVDLTINVVSVKNFDVTSAKRMWVYPNGRFWAYDHSSTFACHLDTGSRTKRATILSNLKVSEDLNAAEVRD